MKFLYTLATVARASVKKHTTSTLRQHCGQLGRQRCAPPARRELDTPATRAARVHRLVAQVVLPIVDVATDLNLVVDWLSSDENWDRLFGQLALAIFIVHSIAQIVWGFLMDMKFIPDFGEDDEPQAKEKFMLRWVPVSFLTSITQLRVPMMKLRFWDEDNLPDVDAESSDLKKSIAVIGNATLEPEKLPLFRMILMCFEDIPWMLLTVTKIAIDRRRFGVKVSASEVLGLVVSLFSFCIGSADLLIDGDAFIGYKVLAVPYFMACCIMRIATLVLFIVVGRSTAIVIVVAWLGVRFLVTVAIFFDFGKLDYDDGGCAKVFFGACFLFIFYLFPYYLLQFLLPVGNTWESLSWETTESVEPLENLDCDKRPSYILFSNHAEGNYRWHASFNIVLHIVEFFVWNALRKALFDSPSTTHITYRTQVIPFIFFVGFGALLVLLFCLRKCLSCCVDADND